ncbi:MAG TPA: hypothetical protein VH419_06990, partial [Nocardioidaceae bacterium]
PAGKVSAPTRRATRQLEDHPSMAGKDPDDYRPRRAFDDSEADGGTGTSDTGKRDTDRRDVEPDRSTTILPRVRDDRSTTILPKTSERRRHRDELDDDEADVRPPMGRRTRLALTIGAVAVVVILGLVLGYVALNNGRPATEPSTGVSIDTSSGETPTPTPVALLDDASMINEQMAKQIDPKRTWQVASTQRGLDANSPRAVCFASDPVEGQPDPQQTIQRLISSTGKNAPALLHQAEAYGTPEEAAQAYVAISKALGSCAVVGAWIDSGRTISGLGDQSAGAIVVVTDAGKQTYHSMVISRTGRVVDVVDVAQPGSAADIGDSARALGEAVTVQCQTSGGACAEKVSVKSGPPPLGGDEPGFLAAGDLPPVGATPTLWVGSTPAPPDADYTGSNCETTDWSKVDATTKTMRTYTLEGNPSHFGVDQIILTMSDDKAAADLVDKVKKDLESCSDRKLTATVSKPEEIKAPGAENNEVQGWSADVSHKTASSTVKYRVGIVSVGPKVVWTLANPTDNLDFSEDQWKTIALRAGQRASQVQ